MPNEEVHEVDLHRPAALAEARNWLRALQDEPLVTTVVALGAAGVSLINWREHWLATLLGFFLTALALLAPIKLAQRVADELLSPVLLGLAETQQLYPTRISPWARIFLRPLLLRVALVCIGALSTWAILRLAVLSSLATIVFAICCALLGPLLSLFASRFVAVISIPLCAPFLLFCGLFISGRRIREPVAMWASQANQRKIRISHISDVHLFENERNLSSSGKRIDARAGFVRALAATQAVDPNVLAITGDLTDAAEPDAWHQFLKSIEGLPASLRASTYVVPGNHDLNLVVTDEFLPDPQSAPWRKLWTRARFLPLERSGSMSRRSRCLRALLALNEVCGARLVASDGQTLAQHLDNRQADIMAFCSGRLRREFSSVDRGNPEAKRDDAGSVPPVVLDGVVWTPDEVEMTSKETTRGLGVVDELWNAVWPMGAIDTESGLVVLHLNSTRAATSVASNAFGEIGRRQLQAAVALRAALETRAKGFGTLILLHHSLAPDPEGQLIAGLKSAFLALIDGVDLMRAFRTYRPLILSGHTHRVMNFESEECVWRSVDSSASPRPHGHRVYEVCFDATGRVNEVLDSPSQSDQT
ncbi:MAG: metallophosphoesterase [Archangium sp.]